MVQVVDVDGTETCSDLASYPFSPVGAAGGLLESTPVLCGGKPEEAKSKTECYSYDKDSNTWNLLANLVDGRVAELYGIARRGAKWQGASLTYNNIT